MAGGTNRAVTKKHHANDLKIDFIPVESASKAGASISIYLGMAQDFIVLLDSDDAGNTAKTKYLDKLPIRETQITQIGDVLSGKKAIEDLISKTFRDQIKAKYNSRKKIKDLLLIAFSEDFYGDATLNADTETLDNLKTLTNALKQRLKDLKS